MLRKRIKLYLYLFCFALAIVFTVGYALKIKEAEEPVASGPSVSAGINWPTYGGDVKNSFSNFQSAISSKNISRLKPAWFAKADGEVSGNPIIVNGVVYFTTDSGSVYAVNQNSGREIWVKKMDGSPINSGPLYDEDAVFISTSAGRVFALSPSTGRTVWETGVIFGNLPDALRASPRAWDGVIYQSLGGTDDNKSERGGVVALDEKTGSELWKTDLVDYGGGGSAVFSPPAIIPQLNELVVTTGNPTPYPSNESQVNEGPVPAGRDLYSDSFVALSLKDGRVLWYKQVHRGDANDLDFMAAPNTLSTIKGGVAIGAGSKDGHYYLVDAKNGDLIWDADLTLNQQKTLIMTSAASGQNSIFLGTMDALDGVSTWPKNYQSPGSGRAVRLDASTGRIVWSEDLGATIAAAPVITNNILFIMDAQGTLFALDSENGKTLSQFKTGGQIWNAEAALSAAQNMVFVPLSKKNGLLAFRLQ